MFPSGRCRNIGHVDEMRLHGADDGGTDRVDEPLHVRAVVCCRLDDQPVDAEPGVAETCPRSPSPAVLWISTTGFSLSPPARALRWWRSMPPSPGRSPQRPVALHGRHVDCGRGSV